MPTKKSVIIAMLLMAASGVALAAGPEEAIQAVAQLANAVSVADLIIKAGHNEDGTPKIHKVPTLKVVRDCADCKFGNALRMLVVAAYKQEAEKNGLEVDPDASVVLRVTSTFERPTFLRGTFGVLAGADFIAGNLGDRTVREFSISHEMGIDGVASLVGERALQYLVQDVAAKE